MHARLQTRSQTARHSDQSVPTSAVALTAAELPHSANALPLHSAAQSTPAQCAPRLPQRKRSQAVAGSCSDQQSTNHGRFSLARRTAHYLPDTELMRADFSRYSSRTSASLRETQDSAEMWRICAKRISGIHRTTYPHQPSHNRKADSMTAADNI